MRGGPATPFRTVSQQTVALAAMMFAVAMTFIDQTIVSIAAPDIVRELDLSSSGMQWVVNAYLLSLAAFFALGGRLADLSMRDQWPYAALAGAGIGFLLAPASTDAVNRAIGASYGEVTGITQTVRNYAASVGLAVYGTVLTHVTTDNVVRTLRSRGMPAGDADAVARDITESVTGNGDSRPPTGTGPAAEATRDAMDAVRMDFAEANQWVFYGMAIALGIGFLCALRHPGGRAATTATAKEPVARAVTAGRRPYGGLTG